MKAAQSSDLFRYLLDQALSPSVAFAVGWALLGWAKLSELSRLPESAKVHRALEDGQAFIGDALSKAVIASEDQLLNDLLSLKGLPRENIERLVHMAWEILQSGELDNLSLEEVLSLDKNSFEHGESLGSQAQGTFPLLPRELVELMVELGEVKSHDSVYTPWDTSSQFSIAVHRLGAIPYTETPERQNVTRLVQLLANIEAPVHCTDPVVQPTALSQKGGLAQFDVALACPPFGGRYERYVSQQDQWGRFPEQTTSSTVLVVRHLLAQAKRRVVVLVPSTLLSGAGAEAQLRNDLVRRGMIRAVLAMPKGLLPVTGVATAVLVLDPHGGNEQVHFIDVGHGPFYKPVSKTRWSLIDPVHLARRIHQSPALLPSTSEATRTRSEILDANTLQVSRLLAQATSSFTPPPSQPLVRLADLVHTVRPLHPTLRKASQSTETTFRVHEVGAQDLPSHGYIRDAPRQLDLPVQLLAQTESLYLEPLDIVLIVKGGAGKVGIVSKDVRQLSTPWIVGQSGIVLRMQAFAPVDARALFLLLRSNQGQELLQSIVVGATTPLIQLRELMALSIWLPNSQLQDEAIQALELEDNLQDQIDQLRHEQAAITAHLWAQP
ncbi:N-6 DNA methylase [Comamonas suwonensis]|uniref:site-specific DNA-methyltransferase (adenine-specific) n=1 Tax=Comamonas suwonensis TaxID=2606214 RepID=A0A843B9X9_9BURK|nr:N-6 DNA methylase [Comamonas suwonensis]MBI1625910.1 N-6 DNA methylase [Comamonas suwonensis]